MKKLLAALIVLAVVASGAYVYFSPYLALDGMRKAAAARDAAALSSYVDYPALRQSLRAQLSAKLAAAPGAGKGGILGIANAFAGLAVEPMVESMITPEGLALMLAGSPPPGAKPTPAEGAPGAGGVTTTLGYEDANTFVLEVVAPNTVLGGKPPRFGFVLGRDGLVLWKLTAIRLPDLGWW